jgi:DNA polymerase I-like protein with 3'-5' exonuclease and polymerase domains/uracil-DNA glycosylase
VSAVRTIGPLGAKILIVGDLPAEQDILKGEPFVGGGGYELNKLLNEAGTFREHCALTLVMQDRVKGASVDNVVATTKKAITVEHVLYKGKYVLPEVVEGIERLRATIERVKPNVVVPTGNLGLWALTGEWSTNNWRSSIMESTLVPGTKVIPTLSPARLMAQWSIRPIMVHDLKRAVRESAFPEIRRPAYEFIIRPNFEQAEAALQGLIAKAEAAQAEGRRMKLAGDIETRAGHIACIAFAWSATEAVCIPLMCQSSTEGYWTEEQEVHLVEMMIRLMRICEIVGQNWNYDAQYIYRHWHFLCPNVKDTMIQQHSCFSNLDKNLAFLSSMYCDDHLYWKDDRTNWTEGPKGEGEDKYWAYNCTDAVRTYAIEEVLGKVIPALGLSEVEHFQQVLAPVVLKTMNKGLRIDYAERLKLKGRLLQGIVERENWLAEVLGREVNIKSPKQMQELFYTEFGLKPIINRKTKTVTTDDEALQKLAVREPILAPVARKIRELRSLGVFNSTFIEARPDVDGRMRCSFNVCGTDTYRFASRQNAFGTGLNMQNIPSGGEMEDDGLELPNVRTIFIPDEGREFFDIDLDSADLRIVTWESSCQRMKQWFREGKKPYIEVMKEYYQNPDMTKSSHPREYAMFKALCHGTNYLGTPQGISPRIGLEVGRVAKIQEWYFSLCPEIRLWQEDIKKQVSGRRWIKNVFGYKFHFFDRIEGNVFNQAVAWLPQSSVACLINRGYEAIDRTLPEVDVLIQVHDSLAGQFPIVNREKHIAGIINAAQIALPYDDPLVIPVGVKTSTKSWGDCA